MAGAALIAAAIVFAPVAGAAQAGFMGAAGTGALSAGASIALGQIGAYLVLTGVAGIISPTPKTPEMDSDPRENFSFSGVQNTSRAGVVVPVIYGEVVTGSITISAGLNTEGD